MNNWPGSVSDFHGYNLHSFTLNDIECKVATPKTAIDGRPWVWRARFWGHAPGPDIALLGKGFHIAYIDVSDLFGSQTAIERFNAFYAYLTKEHFFNQRVVLECMSRGGLITFNWTAQNADKVHCIYADAPVCDFKSWPAGHFQGTGNPSSWDRCLAAYGFSEEEALAFKGNPIDNLAPLAHADIPLLHVVGDDDTAVPVAENTAIIEELYKSLGGRIKVIHKPGVGHTHGLEDPTPIVEFILNEAL
ncbi:alpha/beta hydrolase [Puniceicoccaceae bacterium K14]|nr:alpha/beta hydrolase [Puniceicoccaceae bacterium K14]